jgi:hypothetical protein
MYTHTQPTLSASITSTRRRFMLTAVAAAAAYGTMGTQRRAHAAIVQTDTARLPPLPLPAGIRSRYVSISMGLPFTCWKPASRRRVDLVCYSSTDIRNLPMVGGR